MPMAWIENEKIRDICFGGFPSNCYHPDVAKFYSVEVPDDAKPGMVLIDGNWSFETPQIINLEPTPEAPQ